MISRNAPFLMPDGKTISREWAAYLLSLAQTGDFVVSFNGRKGTVNLAGSDVIAALGYTPVTSDSPVLTGNPTAPTPALGNNSKSLATTAFVQGTVGGITSKDVSGGSNITLTAAEAGAGILVFTGTLTADISVIVPAASKGWIVSNQTSGDFTLTLATAAGTGIVIAQGYNRQLWCDGTNVLESRNDFTDAALTGAPTAPTADDGTSTDQVATTKFVMNNQGGSAGTWQTPTLLNSWVNYGTPFSPASYCIDTLGVVRLRGLVKSGIVGSSTPIFTLPTGFRPPYEYIFSTVNNDVFGRLYVNTSGNVFVVAGDNTGVSLDGITFRNA